MKIINRNTGSREQQVNCARLKWQITAFLLPIAIAVLVLMSISFIKEKATVNYQTNYSFCASDIIWKLTMPALDAALK